MPLGQSKRLELTVGECEIYNEERRLEMRVLDECDRETFSTLVADNSYPRR